MRKILLGFLGALSVGMVCRQPAASCGSALVMAQESARSQEAAEPPTRAARRRAEGTSRPATRAAETPLSPAEKQRMREFLAEKAAREKMLRSLPRDQARALLEREKTERILRVKQSVEAAREAAKGGLKRQGTADSSLSGLSRPRNVGAPRTPDERWRHQFIGRLALLDRLQELLAEDPTEVRRIERLRQDLWSRQQRKSTERGGRRRSERGGELGEPAPEGQGEER